jgi:hypothetical protein
MPGLIQQHWLSPMGSNAVRLAKAAPSCGQARFSNRAGQAALALVCASRNRPAHDSPQTKPAPATPTAHDKAGLVWPCAGSGKTAWSGATKGLDSTCCGKFRWCV